MKQFNFLLLCAVMLLSLPSLGQKHSSATYQNPVIAGDFPDPTIIRVGEIYYAAGTTSDFAPNYPIYESSDLVNWKQIGSVFNKLPEWASDNFWAPELYYKNGVFYVYYTAKRKGDRVSCIGVGTTTDIYKGFTDQGIVVEWGNEAIDAFVFQDDDLKTYISWKAYGLNQERPIEILASELSSDGLSLVGEHFSLTRFDQGWEGSGDEGQCLVKHGEYYYLLYSIGGCCDNQCDYRVRVSRSKNLKDGWKQYPEPILQGGKEWKCPGHGTLVTTPDQRYFYLYHSYNTTDFEYVGRQGLLDELVWDDKSGWPRFKNGNTPSVQAEMPFAATSQLRDPVYSDDFSTDQNLILWQWDLTRQKPEINVNKGLLRLSNLGEGFTFTGISPKTGNYSFEAELAQKTAKNSGIGVYGNSKNLLAFAAGGSKLILLQLKNGTKEILSEISIPENALISLKLEVLHGRIYQFFYSTDQTNWIPFKIQNEYSVDGNFLPQWGVAMRTGLFVDGKKGESGSFNSVLMNYMY
ncbi:MAG TPA: family 43 glycosylhydrolase [Prolixibacteraceae bacterium]|nr:family 43 glycosylhydrolase [Prolixibacteraceae bacterium]